MVMVGFAFFVMSFLFVRMLISLINLLTRNYLPEGETDRQPLLSILIPARNEDKSLPLLLQDLKQVSYPNLEIIVCDDNSTDNTPEILKSFSLQMPGLRYFCGQDLPEGWLGKNYACHQLAQQAKGDFLLFLDADVRVSAKMPSKAVQYIQKLNMDLVSVFPTQLMQTHGELITVPVMNWILLSLLPLPLVRQTGFASLSAANGQFMLFNAASYRNNYWHKTVKNEATEDIVISRMIKKQGGKVSTLTGGSDVFCRMYETSGEAIGGFSRNVHQYFGGSRLVMILFTLTVLLGWIPVWLYFGWVGIKWYLLMVIANRVFIAMASRQKSLTVWLHPLQMINFAIITVLNIVQKIKGNIEWKGRKIGI
jgi:glycosyltransferase involved in cell wall biosynthesis